MIQTLSDLIKEFISVEVDILNKQNIKHPPTIGKMYEGLTEYILNKTIFDHLNLKVVKNSFVKGCKKEFDVMLIEGNGKQIPYTESYEYKPEQVIAIIQVKKNLYSKDLEDGNENLRFLVDYYKRKELEPYNYQLFNDSFRSITRKKLNTDLTIEEEGIYSTLRLEALLPARIIWGYNGFKNESKFRDSFINYIDKNITKDINNPIKYFGPHNFPNLIISGDFSIIKANGMPYITPMEEDGWWNFLNTSSFNPIYYFIEILWTKLSYKYKLTNAIFGEDLAMEPANKFLSCKAIKTQNISGWQYNYYEMKEKELKINNKTKEWIPIEIDEIQYSILNELCINNIVDLENNLSLEKYIKTGSYNSLNEFIAKISKTGLVTIENNKLKLLTDQCLVAILPDGRYIAGENKNGRFLKWIIKNY